MLPGWESSPRRHSSSTKAPTDMTTPHLTSLLITERRAERGRRGRGGVSVGAFGDLKATREIQTPSFSLPVVRELPPRVIRSSATW